MRGTYSGDGERRLNGAGQAEEAADFVLDVVRRLLFNKMYFRLKRSWEYVEGVPQSRKVA